MRRFPVLLSILFLLTGCAASAPQLAQEALSDPDALCWALYNADSPLEAATEGALFCYPLKGIDCMGLLPCTDGVILFAAGDNTTQLAKLDIETGCADTFLELPFVFPCEEPYVRNCGSRISCFDAASGQLVIIDESLQILHRIPAPDGLIGCPILSQDGNTLYYCTGSAIRSLELTSGISRILKESSDPGQTVEALILNDSVLQCRLSDQNTIFLSTQTGATLGISQRLIASESSSDCFFGLLQEGNLETLVFGKSGSPLQTLMLPDFQNKQYILPSLSAMVAVPTRNDPETVLQYYDLLSGQCTATLSLPSGATARSFCALKDGSVCFLQYDSQNGRDTLYRWKPSLCAAKDIETYTDFYYTREQPDEAGLSECQDYAAQLSQQFGIEIRIGKDAVAFQPQGCKLIYEHLPPVLMWELRRLEENLNNYPIAVLQALAQRFDSLSICILRQISPAPGEQEGMGITFWDGHHPHIALAAGTDTERALYHEMCHLIDTIVLNESSAYDTWNQLNPTGFEYDYDYGANQSRNSTAFLMDSNRYFVDMYSMSFPKEDRARIMEYAMTAGNESLFQGEPMQAKLQTLCIGIRKAFRLTKSTETYLWEQYLKTPLAAKE